VTVQVEVQVEEAAAHTSFPCEVARLSAIHLDAALV
jgi:hypothetical protein